MSIELVCARAAANVAAGCVRDLRELGGRQPSDDPGAVPLQSASTRKYFLKLALIVFVFIFHNLCPRRGRCCLLYAICAAKWGCRTYLKFWDVTPFLCCIVL